MSTTTHGACYRCDVKTSLHCLLTVRYGGPESPTRPSSLMKRAEETSSPVSHGTQRNTENTTTADQSRRQQGALRIKEPSKDALVVKLLKMTDLEWAQNVWVFANYYRAILKKTNLLFEKSFFWQKPFKFCGFKASQLTICCFSLPQFQVNLIIFTF